MRVQPSRQYARALAQFAAVNRLLYTQKLGQGPQVQGRIASHSHGRLGGALHMLVFTDQKKSPSCLWRTLLVSSCTSDSGYN